MTYATFNVQGSGNNLCDTAPDPDEYAARNAANIAWLQDTFDEATADGSAAVMLIVQADPGWDDSGVTRAPTRDPKTLAEDDGLPDGFLAEGDDRLPHAGGLLLPAADRAGEQGRGSRALIVSKRLGVMRQPLDPTATFESRSGRLLTGRAAFAVYL